MKTIIIKWQKRIVKAWNVLCGKEEVDDQKMVNLTIFSATEAKDLINHFEQNLMIKRMDKLEHMVQHLMIRTEQILEFQRGTQEIMVAFSTASEEISHGFEVLTDSILHNNPQQEQEQQTKNNVTAKSSNDIFSQYPALDGRNKKPTNNNGFN